MYFIELSQKAQKFLDKLSIQERARIKNKLKNLEKNPVLGKS